MNHVSKHRDKRRGSASTAGWPLVLGGWGVPKSLRPLRSPYRWLPHSQIFFSKLEDFWLSNEIKKIKRRVISTASVTAATVEALFIFWRQAPRGWSKVWCLSNADRWAKFTHLVASFGNLFFWPQPGF